MVLLKASADASASTNRAHRFTISRVHLFVFLALPAGMYKTQIVFKILNAIDKRFVKAKAI